TAAGHVQKRLVPKPAPAGQAEPAARGDEPTLLGLRNPVGPASAEEGHEAHFEILAFLVGRLAVAFVANDPHAGLIVAAAPLAAASLLSLRRPPRKPEGSRQPAIVDSAGIGVGVGSPPGWVVRRDFPGGVWLLLLVELPAFAPI